MIPVCHTLKLQRLNELECLLCQAQGGQCSPLWLEEYLDLGLEMAGNKTAPWQEGWLQRLFKTLLKAAHNPSANPLWQQACADYLYLPFFALCQLYRGQASKNCQLCDLLRHYQAVELMRSNRRAGRQAVVLQS